jgi:Cytochrome c/c1 heme lyase
MVSSIPRGVTTNSDDKGPSHQPTQQAGAVAAPPVSQNWLYPSEQQFFNALRKKGWNKVPASSVPSV